MVQINHRGLIIVPELDEFDDEDGQEDVFDKREGDLEENAPVPSPVDASRFEIILRHAFKRRIEDEEIEAEHVRFQQGCADDIIDDEGIVADFEFGNEFKFAGLPADKRDDHRHQNRGINDFARFEIESSAGIGREARDKRLKKSGKYGIDEAVAQNIKEILLSFIWKAVKLQFLDDLGEMEFEMGRHLVVGPAVPNEGHLVGGLEGNENRPANQEGQECRVNKQDDQNENGRGGQFIV